MNIKQTCPYTYLKSDIMVTCMEQSLSNTLGQAGRMEANLLCSSSNVYVSLLAREISTRSKLTHHHTAIFCV